MHQVYRYRQRTRGRAWLDEVEPSRTAEGPPPAVREETSAQTNKQTLPTIKTYRNEKPAVQTNKCTRTQTNAHAHAHAHAHTHAHLRSAPLFPFAKHHIGYLGGPTARWKTYLCTIGPEPNCWTESANHGLDSVNT